MREVNALLVGRFESLASLCSWQSYMRFGGAFRETNLNVARSALAQPIVGRTQPRRASAPALREDRP
jgi:hypothetical protein